MKRYFWSVAAISLLCGAPAAWASMEKWDTTPCTRNSTQVVKSRVTYAVSHYPAPDGYNHWNNGSTYRSRSGNATAGGGGLWFVYSSGSIDGPNTYAYCVTGTP